jgi:hypothetical protein
MSTSENDPPLADKPKLSSLTEFEVRALKLQKEGKDSEVQKEITSRGLQKEQPEVPPPSGVATGEDLRLYNSILSTVNNPISLDKVPPKQRAQIEEGIIFLKELIEDKETLNALRASHEAAFKASTEGVNEFKAPVLPPELMPNKKEPIKESGDVSTIKEGSTGPVGHQGAQGEPGEPYYVDPQTINKSAPASSKKDGGMEFINDIASTKLDHLKPKPYKEPEPQFDVPAPELSREPTQQFSLIDNCPHCGWDLKKSDLTEVSEEDRYDFVQSILGAIRFKKAYDMFNGQWKVTFRALTSKEADLAFRQIVIDGQTDFNGRALAGTDFYWRNLQAYRMAMCLESIHSDTYGTIEVPTLADAQIEDFTGKDLQSKLVPFLNHVLDTYLPLESTRAVIGHAYYEFQALCDKLQVMAEQPNFWKAIG